MSDQSVDKKVLGGRALELVMRDVLYGMEDLATRLGYDVTPYRVEILAIEPDRSWTGNDRPAANRGVVVPFPQIDADARLAARRKKKIHL